MGRLFALASVGGLEFSVAGLWNSDCVALGAEMKRKTRLEYTTEFLKVKALQKPVCKTLFRRPSTIHLGRGTRSAASRWQGLFPGASAARSACVAAWRKMTSKIRQNDVKNTVGIRQKYVKNTVGIRQIDVKMTSEIQSTK